MPENLILERQSSG